MSDSDNFGSDLESDSLGSHLGASDEEVDECSAVNAVRMQPTRDLGGPEDWGRLKTLENECALQVLDDEDLYDDEVLPTTQARSALAKRRVQALLKSAQELANPFDKLVVDGDEVLTEDGHGVFKVFNRVFVALCSQAHDKVEEAATFGVGNYFNILQRDMDQLVTAVVSGDSDDIAMHRKDFFEYYMPHFHDIDIDRHCSDEDGSPGEINKKLAIDTGYAVDVEWDLNPDSNYEGYGVPEFMELVNVKAVARTTSDVALVVRAYIGFDDIDDIDDIDISTSTDTSTSTVVADGSCAASALQLRMLHQRLLVLMARNRKC